ncbi:MAG: thioredoxin family protein [Acidobacteriota bacterium]|nr:thioredoxin family protein [Acidobacteriota bacterium]
MSSFSRPIALLSCRIAVLGVLMSLVWVLGVPASAQVPADSVLRGFVPTGDFIVTVDGVEQPKAKLYQSQRAGAFLLRSAGFEQPLMISPRAGVVQTVPLMSLALRGDGSADILADAELVPVGGFQFEGDDVVFTVQGKEVRLKQRPDLTGAHSGQGLRDYNPRYVMLADDYTPDAAAIQSLRNSSKDIRVRTFFGSWCSFCKRYVPRFLRVEEELAGSGIDFDYYGLARNFSDDQEAKSNGVHGVPTGIVYVGGKEVGRIERNDWQAPEKALLKLVNGG